MHKNAYGPVSALQSVLDILEKNAFKLSIHTLVQNISECNLILLAGQMEGSPDHRYDFNENSSMEHLIHICTKLGVGHHGYLTQLELGLVCQFIGMEQMEDEVRSQNISVHD